MPKSKPKPTLKNATAHQVKAGDEIATSPIFAVETSTRKVQEVQKSTQGVRLCLDNGRCLDLDHDERVRIVRGHK